MTSETGPERRKREAQRVLFDGVAGLYEDARQSYPSEMVDTLLGTPALKPGASVLEIGCGTGQLTRDLCGRGLRITAIDIGRAMISGARRRLADPEVSFVVSSFEDYRAEASYDLVVSATAFHWVDPLVGWAKAARLLQPSGWLALLTTGERYDEPLRSSLRELWVKHNRDPGPWTARAPWAEVLKGTGLFGPVVEASHEQRVTLPTETVLGVETTRATFLSFDEAGQHGFTTDLGRLLGGRAELELTQETHLAMAPVVAA